MITCQRCGVRQAGEDGNCPFCSLVERIDENPLRDTIPIENVFEYVKKRRNEGIPLFEIKKELETQGVFPKRRR